MSVAAPATPSVRSQPRASWLADLWSSALGKKAVMALTGVFLFGWILAHMLGNLKLYFGPEHMNTYAQWLRTMGAPAVPNDVPLWIVRGLLLIAVWLHIQAATQLTLMNKASRPVEYAERDYVVGTYAARTMRWGGVLIALFVLYHLAHLTWGWSVAKPATYVEADPYHNVVAGFQVWWVSAIYILANLALGLHLYHGLWSMFNSLGLNHAKFNPWKRIFATAFALVISLANISFPIAVLVGFVR